MPAEMQEQLARRVVPGAMTALAAAMLAAALPVVLEAATLVVVLAVQARGPSATCRQVASAVLAVEKAATLVAHLEELRLDQAVQLTCIAARLPTSYD